MHDLERPPKRSDRRLSGVRSSQSSRVGSGGPLPELQALQHTAGNRAVVRLVAQRMDAEHPVTQGVQTQTTVGNITEEDRGILLNYRNETQAPAVQALLDELFVHLDRVSFERTGGATGGNTRHRGDGQYSVSYARPADMDTHDHIAVLVHELTHVVVNEAYNSDMLNYSVPALTDTERRDTLEETPGREEDIQNARLGKVDVGQRNSFIDHVMANVRSLRSQLPGSGLSSERQQMIATKLELHTLQRPYHEYDAVLSHLLTWCDKDGADQSSEFYRSLTTMVAQAAAWRASGAITLPEAAPEAASAAPAGGAAGGRTGGRSGRKVRDRVKGVLKKLARIFRRR